MGLIEQLAKKRTLLETWVNYWVKRAWIHLVAEVKVVTARASIFK
jgi:hypothetical protein